MTDDPILRKMAEEKAERLRNRISQRLRHIANRVRKDLKDLQLPGEPEPVFALFVATAGAAQYIGNGSREDIKRVVGSVISRWDDPAHAALHKAWHEKTDEEKAVEKDNPL